MNDTMIMYSIPYNNSYDTIIPKCVIIEQDKIKYEYAITDEFILKPCLNKNINSFNSYNETLKMHKTNRYLTKSRKIRKYANIPIYVKIYRQK